MKKLKYLFIFLFAIVTLLSIDNVFAYTCEYKGDGLSSKIKVDKTYGVSKDVEQTIGKYKEELLNWKEPYAGFSAGSYQFAGLCPTYLLYFHINPGANIKGDKYWELLYVADKNYKDIIIEQVKSEETVQKGYPKVLKLVEQPKKEEVDTPISCLDFAEKADSSAKKGTAEYYSCENNPYFACIWVETDSGGYCNTDKLQYVSCGDAVDIPPEVPSLISFFVDLLKILTPIILIFTSIITLFKAMSASKEDEIKKATSTLVRRIIAAVLVFFVISIVQFVIMKVADTSEKKNLSTCLSCFLNNDCSDNTYYKTNVSGEYECHSLDGSEIDCATGE